MTYQLQIERRIAARPETVYPFLTDSEKWAQWQGVAAEIEAQPGGRFEMTMADGRKASGEFVAVESDRRVTFTWGWAGSDDIPPGSTTVDIRLVPEGGGTLLRLTHSDLPAGEEKLHEMGWRFYLERLGLSATGHDPGIDSGPGG